MRRLWQKISELGLYAAGFSAAVYIVWNSCDAQGVDAHGFVPGAIAAVALGKAIIQKFKTF